MSPNYLCPVCGFKHLAQPPADFSICPCCATQFGYDDLKLSPLQLRDHWLETGAHWLDPANPYYPHRNWDPWHQLDAACLPYSVPRPQNYQPAA